MAMNRVRWTGTAVLLAALAALSIAACDSGSWFASDSDEKHASACADCHAREALAWENDSSHALIYACEDCHAKASSDAAPGHRTKPACDQCHSEAAHPPAGQWDLSISCRTCHDPHGSKNLFLVPETIPVDGEPVSVDFRNLDGLADSSYAEPNSPGKGLCEICHDQTLYYNRTGDGAPHYAQRCTTCHNHAEAFAPTAP